MADNTELTNRVVKLEQQMKAVLADIELLKVEMNKYATQGQVKTSEANTKNIINQNSILINDIQQQLQTIVIPDDTKYYLKNSEIEEFRSNYTRLIALVTDAEKLHQSIIAYVAQLDM